MGLMCRQTLPPRIIGMPGLTRKTLVILAAPYKGLFCSKIDQITHIRNQNQVPGPATSFLTGETVGFCLNAHAGPLWKVAPEGRSERSSLVYGRCKETSGSG